MRIRVFLLIYCCDSQKLFLSYQGHKSSLMLSVPCRRREDDLEGQQRYEMVCTQSAEEHPSCVERPSAGSNTEALGNGPEIGYSI